MYFIFFIGGVVCVLGRLGCLINSVIEDVVSGRLWIVVGSDWMYWIGGWLCECCGFFYLKLNIKFLKIYYNYKSKRLWNLKICYNFKSKRLWNLIE